MDLNGFNWIWVRFGMYLGCIWDDLVDFDCMPALKKV